MLLLGLIAAGLTGCAIHPVETPLAAAHRLAQDRDVLKELRRLGGLLKHLHNQSQGTYTQETADTLRALKVYFEHLSRDR